MALRIINCESGAIAGLCVRVPELASCSTRHAPRQTRIIPDGVLRQVLVASDDRKVVDCVTETRGRVEDLREILNETSRQVRKARRARRTPGAQCEKSREQQQLVRGRAERECDCERRALADLWIAYGMIGGLLEECEVLRKQLRR